MQSRLSAREIDDTVLFAYDRELLQFEHRLTTIGAIADSMEGHMQISTFQVRLHQMIETLASDGAKLQGIWDVMNELREGRSQREAKGVDKE